MKEAASGLLQSDYPQQANLQQNAGESQQLRAFLPDWHNDVPSEHGSFHTRVFGFKKKRHRAPQWRNASALTLPITGFLESGRRIALVETNAEDTADLPPVQLLIL
jgi:hypothetical protein